MANKLSFQLSFKDSTSSNSSSKNHGCYHECEDLITRERERERAHYIVTRESSEV